VIGRAREHISTVLAISQGFNHDHPYGVLPRTYFPSESTPQLLFTPFTTVLQTAVPI
jgi:hypothetical protein